MSQQAEALHHLLLRLEQALKQCHLWRSEPPAPEAFLSTQPFCVDTMSFAEWLQWVFVARLRALLEAQRPLPQGSQVAPLAAELWKGQPEALHLCPVLEKIDACLNGENHAQ